MSADPLDRFLDSGGTLVCCKSGNGVVAVAVVRDETKYETAHGKDLQEAIGNLWEKVNARNQQADAARERRDRP